MEPGTITIIGVVALFLAALGIGRFIYAMIG